MSGFKQRVNDSFTPQIWIRGLSHAGRSKVGKYYLSQLVGKSKLARQFTDSGRNAITIRYKPNG